MIEEVDGVGPINPQFLKFTNEVAINHKYNFKKTHFIN